MKRKNRFSELLRPLGALALAGATLWTVSVTAGSATAADAWAALRQEVPLTLLRWQLGDPGLPDGLSPAAVLTLSQSPLLLSARRDIYELRRQSEETPEAEAPAPVTQPVEETPQTPEAETSAGTDNGVAAKTLIPTDPSGYTVFGRVYISNSTKYTLSSEELQKPFAAELTGEAPQVLILHTHGSEGYTPVPGTEVVWSGDCRTTDTRYNVVHMGDAIEDSAGNPIKVVSDIDGVGTAAQLSLVVGSDGGGLSHPDWIENLRLAAAVQEQVLTDYPTLMRPLLLRNSRYNQHATHGSLLLEVGTAGNAPEEAELSARLFARELVQVLEERSK